MKPLEVKPPEAQQAAEPAKAAPAEAESPESAQENAAPADDDTGGDGELVDDSDPASTVWVVRGVSRYHLSDCVLIQVVDEEDVDTMTLADARADGCSPCRACHTY